MWPSTTDPEVTGYIRADGPGVDIDAFPFSLLLALRAPLFPTPDRPGGRLQPYAMAGVSFYIVDISARVGGMGGSSFRFGEKKSRADISDHPPRQDE